MVDPVEEQVDFMIDEIDAYISGKYAFKFRDILEHPLDYKDRPTVMVELDKMKNDITAYFDARKTEVVDAVKVYQRDAAASSKVAKQIADVVEAKAKSHKKAIIKPMVFTRREDEDEIFFVEKFDDSYERLVDALLDTALMVVDTSLEIEGYMVGRWVFPDANKNRAIYVSFPINPAGALEIAKDQMLVALDAVKAELQVQLAVGAARR